VIKSSKKHLEDANESYFHHFKVATKIGITMIFGGFQAIFHAFVPGILKTSASNKVKKLFEYLHKRN
tara:strand:+ start:176 stop:376 length:201 start_codon:yes stop_codon:yes gene_type:complete